MNPSLEMARYLIDANLPYRFKLWQGPDYVHVFDLNDRWSDDEIWYYARDNQLTIVSKDADFSDRIVTAAPPPRVIHLRIGNLLIRDLQEFLARTWSRVCLLSEAHKLVRVYLDRIECVA